MMTRAFGGWVVAAAVLLAGCGGSPSADPSTATTGPSQSASPAASGSGTPSSTSPAHSTIAEKCGIEVTGTAQMITDGASRLPTVLVPPTGSDEVPPATVVVLLPQRGDTMCDWVPFAALLAAQGIATVSADLCDSPTASCEFSLREDLKAQVSLVAEWAAKSTGAKRVVVGGASKGGAQALGVGQAAGADAVIDISGPADWTGTPSVEQAAKATTVPLLMIWSPSDSDIAPARLKKAFASSPASQKKAIEVASGHGVEILATEQGDTATITPTGTQLIAWVKALK